MSSASTGIWRCSSGARQRAYALLARNGFDPDMCRTVAASVMDDMPDPDPADPESEIVELD